MKCFKMILLNVCFLFGNVILFIYLWDTYLKYVIEGYSQIYGILQFCKFVRNV